MIHVEPYPNDYVLRFYAEINIYEKRRIRRNHSEHQNYAFGSDWSGNGGKEVLNATGTW